jgi:hypothetical protein
LRCPEAEPKLFVPLRARECRLFAIGAASVASGSRASTAMSTTVRVIKDGSGISTRWLQHMIGVPLPLPDGHQGGDREAFVY